METGDETVKKIRDLLDSRQVDYKYFEHESTPTSEDAARVRGTTPESGAKAIILKTKSGKNLMVVLPGNLKLDSKKIRNYVHEDISFENPDVILEKFGIIIGGVPPYGNILGLETLVDSQLGNNEEIAFNCGKRTASIIMKFSDYLRTSEAKIGDWSKV